MSERIVPAILSEDILDIIAPVQTEVREQEEDYIDNLIQSLQTEAAEHGEFFQI